MNFPSFKLGRDGRPTECVVLFRAVETLISFVDDGVDPGPRLHYDGVMGSLFGNIIWLIFGGFTAAAGMITAGVATCLTIIGFPLGVKQIGVGAAMALPFGRKVQEAKDVSTLQTVLNIIWFVLFGWALVLNHLLFGIVLTITIVGIPFAKQHWKLLKLSAFPFGKTFDPA